MKTCKCAKYNNEEFAYMCNVTGDKCFFLIPDAEKCYEMFNEGPLVDEENEEDE